MATGAMANLKWGLETNFGVKATNVDNLFGYANEISNLEMDNDPAPRRGLGSRNFQAMGFGMFKGSMTLKFDLNDPFVFRLLMGGYSKAGVTGDYDYTFAEADTLPSFTINDYIKNIDGGANTLRQFLGCVVLDWTLDDAVGSEPVTLTLNIAFAGVEEGITSQTAGFPTTAVLNFAHCAWKKAGSTIAKVESLSLKVNQNAELKAYLGSRMAQRAKFGDREYEFTALNYYGVTTTNLQDFYGLLPNTGPLGTGPVKKAYSMVITPAAGTTAATYTFTINDGYISRHGQPQKVNDDIMEDVTILARSISVLAEHCTLSPPTGWV